MSLTAPLARPRLVRASLQMVQRKGREGGGTWGLNQNGDALGSSPGGLQPRGALHSGPSVGRAPCLTASAHTAVETAGFQHSSEAEVPLHPWRIPFKGSFFYLSVSPMAKLRLRAEASLAG